MLKFVKIKKKLTEIIYALHFMRNSVTECADDYIDIIEYMTTMLDYNKKIPGKAEL